MNPFRRLWRSIKDRVRAALDGLPPIDQVWRERRAYASALRALGDRVEQWEPERIGDLEYVRMAARAAQFVAGKNLPGLEKAELVLARVKQAWSAVGIADAAFDKWWASVGRPFLDAYCAAAKADDAWVKP